MTQTTKFFSNIQRDWISTEGKDEMKVVVMDAGDGDDNGDDAIIDAASMDDIIDAPGMEIGNVWPVTQLQSIM